MKFRLLLLTIGLPFFAGAQFLPVETSLQQAYVQANQQDKLIFLMMESADCLQCNNVADKALENDQLKHDLQQNFVAVRISPNHADLPFIREKYNYPGDGNIILYIDKWGTLVHRLNMSTDQFKRYIEENKQAHIRKKEADEIRLLEQEAFTGKMETTRLYTLIQQRKTISLPTDALLDQYVSQLPADSLNSITTLQRIAVMSPILGSKADIELRKNQALFNRAWLGLPVAERVYINKRIIFKSREKAVEERNMTKGLFVADFSKKVHSIGKEGNRAYFYNLMEFYRGIRDTAAFIKAATEYIDQFQMTVNAEEIKKRDSLRFNAIVKNVQADTTRHPNGQITNRKVSRFSGQAQFYGQELTYGASSFYKMTNDAQHLKKALQWAAYANQFYESPYALDTWARLIYKADKDAAQAIQLEEKAIALLTKQGFSTEAHNKVLSKMKQRAVSLD